MPSFYGQLLGLSTAGDAYGNGRGWMSAGQVTLLTLAWLGLPPKEFNGKPAASRAFAVLIEIKREFAKRE